MDKIKKILDKVTSVVAIISISGYIAIALVSFSDFALKATINKPILGAIEIIEVLMICAIFSSFAYAQSTKSHINMPIVIERLPRIPRLISVLITYGLSIYIVFYMTYSIFFKAIDAMQIPQEMTGNLHIKMYPFFFLEAIMLTLFALVLVVDTLIALFAIWNDKYNRMVVTDFGMTNVKEYRDEQAS